MTVALPTLQYLVAFNNGPLDDPGAISTVAAPGTVGGHNVWTDITQWVQSYSMSKGRQHELSQFEAATVSLTLVNEDGRFNPWNTSSPYAGLLTIRKPLQVRAMWSATTYYRFTGHVDSWGTVWGDTVTEFATVHATDAFRILQLALLAATHESVVLLDGPAGFWECSSLSGNPPVGPPTGNLLVTATVGGALSNSVPSSVGISPLPAGPFTGSSSISTPGFNNLLTAGPVVASGATFSIEMWIKTSTAPTSGNVIALWYEGTTVASNQIMLAILPTGKLMVGSLIAGNPPDLVGNTVITDGNWHHIVATYSAGTTCIYVDGNLDATQTGSVFAWSAGVSVFFQGDPNDSSTAFIGNFSYLAHYNVVLTALEVSIHFSLTDFPQESSDSRVNRVLHLIGWPSAATSIDAGVAIIQANSTDLSQTSALQHLQDVQSTEGGALYMDGTGKVRFIARRTPLTDSRYNTTQAAFDDAGNLPWTPSPTLALDDLDLYNQATGQRSGGTRQVDTNETSAGSYGLSTWQPAGQLLGISDTDVLNLCEFIVENKSTPLSRLQSIDVNMWGLAIAGLAGTLLGLDLLYRISVARSSGITGSAFSQVGLIEHMTEQAAPQQWTITMALDIADIKNYWIWGTSEWGEPDPTPTTRWCY